MAESEREELTIRAGEYALGLVDEQERERFEAEMRDSAEARRELAYWDHRLGAMGLALAPVQPPQRLWTRIASAIGLSEGNDDGRAESTPRAGGAGLFWPGLAIAASAAAIVMAAMLFNGQSLRSRQVPDESQVPAYAGVVYDEPTGMSWLVTARKGSDEMSVTAMGSYDVPDGKMLRAWFKPRDGNPIGLGEMPLEPGRRTMSVPAAATAVMDQPLQFVVSLEDVSDAHADAPHGKVMWAVPIARHTS